MVLLSTWQGSLVWVLSERIAYHIDSQTYGPDLGPDGTVVEQFGFIFRAKQ